MFFFLIHQRLSILKMIASLRLKLFPEHYQIGVLTMFWITIFSRKWKRYGQEMKCFFVSNERFFFLLHKRMFLSSRKPIFQCVKKRKIVIVSKTWVLLSTKKKCFYALTSIFVIDRKTFVSLRKPKSLWFIVQNQSFQDVSKTLFSFSLWKPRFCWRIQNIFIAKKTPVLLPEKKASFQDAFSLKICNIFSRRIWKVGFSIRLFPFVAWFSCRNQPI